MRAYSGFTKGSLRSHLRLITGLLIKAHHRFIRVYQVSFKPYSPYHALIEASIFDYAMSFLVEAFGMSSLALCTRLVL